MGETGVKTLMIAGGGTGGHIYPAIAIAKEFVRRDPARKVVFVGTERGLEKKIVPQAGFPLEFITVGGLKGKGLVELARNLAKLPVGIAQAFAVVGKHRPDAVLGVGGYSSGPVLLAAHLRGIPTAIHEQNAFPGVTNRTLAKFVKRVIVAFADALPRLGRTDGIVTGNPVRAEFFEWSDGGPRPEAGEREASAAEPQSHPASGIRHPASAEANDRFRLLVFGGSQGSRVLNEAMTGALLFLAREKDRLDIVHQTGSNDLERVQAAYRASAFPDARVVPYLDPMADEMAAADLVVSRAGAMTIGELAAIGRGAVFVPFAAATNNHQEANARVVETAGGGIVITERELTPERLAAAIAQLTGDRERARRMGENARTLATPDATKKIVDCLEEII